MEEQTATIEQTTTVTAPEVSSSESTSTNPSPAMANSGDSVSVGGPEDAYLSAIKAKRAEREKASFDTSADVQEPENKAEPATTKGEGDEPAKGRKKAKKWWNEKTPDQKDSILLKQSREKAAANEKRIADLEAEIAQLKGKKEGAKKESMTHSDFDNDDDWVNYRIDERLLQLREEENRTAEENQKNRAKAEEWSRAMERAFPDKEELKAANELFLEKLKEISVAPSVIKYIVDSGNPRLLLHIVRNPGAQELLKAGTSELLVGARLGKIERWLESKQAKTPAAKTEPITKREPALSKATGSANNIGNASGIGTNSREAYARERQRLILGLR